MVKTNSLIAAACLVMGLCAGCDAARTDDPDRRLGAYDTHYRIVYRRADGIYAIKSDGTENNKLLHATDHVQDPVWTADGQHLAFVSFQPDESQIFIMSADGSDKRQLTDYPGGSRKPRCSPIDSRQCFYKALNALEEGSSSLRFLDIDGSEDRPLTQQPPFAMDGGSWSGDGQRIAFTGFAERGAGRDLFVVGADGGKLERLTDHPARDSDPDFSPDGSRIAFTSSRGPRGNQDIFVINADGSNLTKLTEYPGRDREPTWSPDGAYIAFISNRGGDMDPYVMKANGTDLQPLVDDTLDSYYHPTWSPDQTRIVYAVDTDQDTVHDTIYIHDLETGTRFRLVEGYSPRWAPVPIK